MYCKNCGAEIDGSSVYCTRCGTNVSDPANQVASPSATSSAGTTPKANYPMKWYKFLINFALFASAVLNIISGFNMITGSVYGSAETANAVYSSFSGLEEESALRAGSSSTRRYTYRSGIPRSRAYREQYYTPQTARTSRI